ncbi:hypothetical protein K439DRAFT_1613586 [Ramaria rubella]|nr:hypothetical protein K439DRAFT_1613586 [Ramaria rubella]
MLLVSMLSLATLKAKVECPLQDLEELCARQAFQNFSNQTDFAKFDRKFVASSTWLRRTNMCGEMELNQLYWKAMNLGFKVKLVSRLEIVLPDHRPTGTYDIKHIRTAAFHILPTTYVNHTKGLIITGIPRDSQDKSGLKGLASQMAATVTYVQEFQFHPIVEEILGLCEVINQFIKEGLLQRNDRNMVCLANGASIPPDPLHCPWVVRIHKFYDTHTHLVRFGTKTATTGEGKVPKQGQNKEGNKVFNMAAIPSKPLATPLLARSLVHGDSQSSMKGTNMMLGLSGYPFNSKGHLEGLTKGHIPALSPTRCLTSISQPLEGKTVRVGHLPNSRNSGNAALRPLEGPVTNRSHSEDQTKPPKIVSPPSLCFTEPFALLDKKTSKEANAITLIPFMHSKHVTQESIC